MKIGGLARVREAASEKGARLGRMKDRSDCTTIIGARSAVLNQPFDRDMFRKNSSIYSDNTMFK